MAGAYLRRWRAHPRGQQVVIDLMRQSHSIHRRFGLQAFCNQLRFEFWRVSAAIRFEGLTLHSVH